MVSHDVAQQAWTQAHNYWLLGQSFALAGTQAAFEDAYQTKATSPSVAGPARHLHAQP